MFTLWYSVLSWKEYREVILGKVSQKLAPNTTPQSKPALPPITPKPELPKSSPTVPKPIPPPPPPKSTAPPKLDPPAKPPRSPSPHPLRTEAFDDIEYEEESEEEEEEDEDSVVDSVPPPKKPENSVNDFINIEIKQQQRDTGPQRYSEQLLKKSK